MNLEARYTNKWQLNRSVVKDSGSAYESWVTKREGYSIRVQWVKKQQNWTWNSGLFKVGNGVRQGCILSPCLFNLYGEYIMQHTGLDESQAKSQLRGEVTSDM